MTLQDLQSQTVGILGFGHEGQALVKYLTEHDIKVNIYDRKPLADSRVYSGEDYLEQAIANCTVLFKSPGVKIPSDLKDELNKHGVSLSSQTAWFFEHCPAKILGVTGTKGKGTTSSLLYEMLRAGLPERKIYLTGNIGKEAPLEFLDQLTADDLVVFELSSFQLEDLTKSPHIGICLMTAPDHLDYHADLGEYYNAKAAIAKYQSLEDYLIYNADYPTSVEIGQLGAGKKFVVSAKSNKEPGAYIEAAQERIVLNVGEQSIELDTHERFIRGAHNLENIAAASLAAMLFGVSLGAMKKVLADFQGLPHRLQLIAEENEIKYFDDSIATNPDTALAGLRAFTEPVVLLLGGKNKGLDYRQFASQLNEVENLKAVVCIGEAGGELATLLRETEFSKSLLGVFTDFPSAVTAAINAAEPGDVVLLSPAATSFDMFQSYAERGDAFAVLIKEHYGQN